jgi:predicted metal-binding protein
VSGRVFVCLTCNRYASNAAGELTPGQRLAAAMRLTAAKVASPVAIRTVECLNGCPHPCTAALRAPGKCVIRFAELTTDDAAALIEAAELYARSPDGDIRPEALPATLRAKVSGRVGARAA